jgi:hypothetical protein
MAFSRRDRRRHWTVAIDTHNVSYYGSRSTPHIVGGQKKQDTNYFHSYATAILIHRHRRTPWSCRSAEYRLLLQGLSLILRQVWVLLTEEIARSRGLKASGKTWFRSRTAFPGRRDGLGRPSYGMLFPAVRLNLRRG